MKRAKVFLTLLALIVSVLASGSVVPHRSLADLGPCRECPQMAPTYGQAGGLSFDLLPN